MHDTWYKQKLNTTDTKPQIPAYNTQQDAKMEDNRSNDLPMKSMTVWFQFSFASIYNHGFSSYFSCRRLCVCPVSALTIQLTENFLSKLWTIINRTFVQSFKKLAQKHYLHIVHGVFLFLKRFIWTFLYDFFNFTTHFRTDREHSKAVPVMFENNKIECSLKICITEIKCLDIYSLFMACFFFFLKHFSWMFI